MRARDGVLDTHKGAVSVQFQSTAAADAVPARSAAPAAAAAARLGRAGILLGALGLSSSLFVISRLVETWRVTPEAASRRITILGQELSYPAANVAAVAVVVLALLGLAMTALTVAGAVRELAASRRFHRALLGGRQRRRVRVRVWVRVWGDVLVIDDERPRAFCAGLLRPRVYVSTGAVALLDEVALHAVLLHERHHMRRHDPLRLAVGRVIARALFFAPGLKAVVARQQALAELSADEHALNAAPENRSALARAMLTFSERSRPDDPSGVDPERVDYLLGEPPSWPFPLVICLLTGSVLGLLVAVGALAGHLASGSATLAPPFLSHQPCVVVLATIPALVGLVGLTFRQKIRAGSITWP
jgi:Zn-dependent protease with chaperone function